MKSPACDKCGYEFDPGEMIYWRDNEMFCSKECLYEANEGQYIILTDAEKCFSCDEEFMPGDDVVEFEGLYFCDRACLWEMLDCETAEAPTGEAMEECWSA
jgi:predicted RNA-binding Zn-ribbon protein involved in translation (DUF1610 family)